MRRFTLPHFGLALGFISLLLMLFAFRAHKAPRPGNHLNSLSPVAQSRTPAIALSSSVEMIAYDTSLARNLAVGAIDEYQFFGSAGDVIKIRAGEAFTAILLKMTLLSPSNQSVEIVQSNYVVAIAHQLVDEGFYTIRIEDDNGADGGDYGLSLQKLNSHEEVSRIGYDTTFASYIEIPGEMEAYSFYADTGEVITIRTGEFSAIVPKIELYNPEGLLINADAENYSSRISQKIENTGWHTLLVMDDNGYATDFDDPFGLSLQKLNSHEEVSRIGYDTTFASYIEIPGEMEAYSFYADTGEVITIRTGEFSAIVPKIELYNPEGLLINADAENYSSRISQKIENTGWHTLLVMDDNGYATDFDDPFGISLQKLNNAGSLADFVKDTVHISFITYYGQVDLYTFFSREGEHVTVRMSESFSAIQSLIELYAPDGSFLKADTAVGSNAPAQISNYEITETGVYSLLAMDDEGNDIDNDDPYSISITGIGADVVRILNPTICRDDSVIVGSSYFHWGNPSGQVVIEDGVEPGIDSIIQIDLQFYPLAESQQNTALCREDSLYVGNEIFHLDHPAGLVRLEGLAAHGCDSLVQVMLEFHPQVAVGNFVGSLCPGESEEIGGMVFDLNNSEGTVILPDASTPYGCDSTVSVTINERENCGSLVPQPALNIPTAFTPNQDGTNDYFVIQVMNGQPDLAGDYPHNRLLIYNRYKTLVKEYAPYDNSWEGTDRQGNRLPLDTYYYFFQLGDDSHLQQSGLVTIIR